MDQHSSGSARARADLLKVIDAFKDVEKEISSALNLEAGLIAVADQASRLRQLAEQYRAILQRERMLKALESINIAISQALDVKEVAKLALHQVIDSLDPSHAHELVGTLQWVDNEAGELVDLYGVGYKSGRENLRIKVGEGVTGRVALSGEPLLISDLHTEEWKERHVPVMEVESRSELAIPLKQNGYVSGVLNLESSLPNVFTEDDLRFVRDVGVQLSIALGNARAYTDLREEQQRRIAAEQGAMLTQAARGLAHHIGNNLGIVPYWVSEIETLLTDSHHLEFHKAEIEDALIQIKSSIDLVLQLSKELQVSFSRKPEALQLINVSEAIKQAIDTIELPHGIDFEITNLCPDIFVKANSWLVGAFVELIRNSIKAMPSGGMLKIGCRIDGEFIEICFRDTGRGFAESDREKIFDLFHRGADQGTTTGFGMGLTAVRSVMRSFDGEVTGTSEGPGQGATFIVRLPTRTNQMSQP